MNVYLQLASESLWLILLLSLPPLIASLTVGLIISLLQALTQVQEQTLTFVPKIIITVIAIVLFAGWTLERLQHFALKAFEMIPEVGRSL